MTLVGLRQANILQNGKAGDADMTPPLDLVECANCDAWFTPAASDEVFHHATGRCRRELSESRPFTDPSPPRNPLMRS
ncbi:MAG: hypothetical protein ABI779_04955 [Acidobacteriota bacterium]